MYNKTLKNDNISEKKSARIQLTTKISKKFLTVRKRRV